MLSTGLLFLLQTSCYGRTGALVRGQTANENYGLALAADTAAYAGRVSEAREMNKKAVDSAIRSDNKENGAIYLANAALQQFTRK